MDQIAQWVFIILIVLLIVYRFKPAKGVVNITVNDAKSKFSEKDIQFIDVRSPSEFKGNHQKPFKNIPLGSLQVKADKLKKEQEVVVICQSGMRSAQAAKMLRKLGFEKVSNVKGGMGAWH